MEVIPRVFRLARRFSPVHCMAGENLLRLPLCPFLRCTRGHSASGEEIRSVDRVDFVDELQLFPNQNPLTSRFARKRKYPDSVISHRDFFLPFDHPPRVSAEAKHARGGGKPADTLSPPRNLVCSWALPPHSSGLPGPVGPESGPFTGPCTMPLAKPITLEGHPSRWDRYGQRVVYI